MGMYTRLSFWAEIDDEAAAVVQRVQSDGQPDDDEFIWMWRPLLCSSAYFNTHGTVLRREYNSWFLNVDSSFKNYENELDRFLEWIHPHMKYCSEIDGFVGFSQYEEAETPTLIFWTKEKLVEHHITPPPHLGEVPWGGR